MLHWTSVLLVSFVQFFCSTLFWQQYNLHFTFRGFFKAGNVVAAVSAFTAAIVLDDSIPSYPFIISLIFNNITKLLLFYSVNLCQASYQTENKEWHDSCLLENIKNFIFSHHGMLIFKNTFRFMEYTMIWRTSWNSFSNYLKYVFSQSGTTAKYLVYCLFSVFHSCFVVRSLLQIKISECSFFDWS